MNQQQVIERIVNDIKTDAKVAAFVIIALDPDITAIGTMLSAQNPQAAKEFARMVVNLTTKAFRAGALSALDASWRAISEANDVRPTLAAGPQTLQ